MKIGDLTLELVKPEKLDEQLVAMTGCPAREMREHLTSAAIADYVGAALIPFVKEPPPRIVLAQAIAAEGVAEVRVAVQKLYDKELGIKPSPIPDHLKPQEAPRGRQAKG